MRRAFPQALTSEFFQSLLYKRDVRTKLYEDSDLLAELYQLAIAYQALLPLNSSDTLDTVTGTKTEPEPWRTHGYFLDTLWRIFSEECEPVTWKMAAEQLLRQLNELEEDGASAVSVFRMNRALYEAVEGIPQFQVLRADQLSRTHNIADVYGDGLYQHDAYHLNRMAKWSQLYGQLMSHTASADQTLPSFLTEDATDFFLNTFWNASTPEEYAQATAQFQDFLTLFDTPQDALTVVDRLVSTASTWLDGTSTINDALGVQQLFELAQTYFELDPKAGTDSLDNGSWSFFLETIRQLDQPLNNVISPRALYFEQNSSASPIGAAPVLRLNQRLLKATQQMNSIGDNRSNVDFLEELMYLGSAYANSGQAYFEAGAEDLDFGLDTLLHGSDDDIATGAAELERWFEGIDPAHHLDILRFQNRLLRFSAPSTTFLFTEDSTSSLSGSPETIAALMDLWATYARLTIPSYTQSDGADGYDFISHNMFFLNSLRTTLDAPSNAVHKGAFAPIHFDIPFSLDQFFQVSSVDSSGKETYTPVDDPVALLQFSTRLLDAVSDSNSLTTEKHDLAFLEALLGVGKSYAALSPEKNDSFFSSWLNKAWSAANDTQLDEAIKEFDKENERFETAQQRLELLQFQNLLLQKLAEPIDNLDEEIPGTNISIDKSLSLSALYAESQYKEDLKVIPEDLKFFDSLWEAKNHSTSDGKDLISDSASEELRKSIEELCSETTPHTFIPTNDPYAYAEYPELLEDYPVSNCAINIGYALFSVIIQPVAPAVPIALAFMESGVEFHRAITGEDLNGDDLSISDRAWAFANAMTQTMLNLLEIKQVKSIVNNLIGDLAIIRGLNMAAEDVSRTVSDAFENTLDEFANLFLSRARQFGWATINNLPPNMRSIQTLNNLVDVALEPTTLRNALIGRDWIKSKRLNSFSIAVAKIEKDGSVEHVLAVSGKALRADAGDEIFVNGIKYKIVRQNSGSAVDVSALNPTDFEFVPNNQHAEQKLASYLQDNYDGQSIDITMSIQNVSAQLSGMCVPCQATIPEFAARNPNFNFVGIFQGTTGTRQ